MAIEYVLLLKDKKVSEAEVLKKIGLLGYSSDKCEQLQKGMYIDLNEEVGFSVTILNTDEYPYNLWESIFCKDEFMMKKIIKFRFAKDYFDFEYRYNIMLEIIFDLVIKKNEEAILINSGNEELCFFRGDGTIVLNNESGAWDRKCFNNVIKDKKIYYLK